ncbi:MAG: SDR family NAD(P)-dependent oxidoreductase [Bacteroidales bacterium]|nr:SDR family NAD(P)-dependent oxidoreductase [Bacteroidales bacterium]
MSGKSEKTDRYKSPVAAIFAGISDLFKRSDHQLDLNDLPSLDGKRVMITGASSGLGFATAVELARRGAHVIMAVRSGIPLKGEKVRSLSGSNKVDMIHMDLSDLESLESFTEELKEKFGPIDIIVCNAAMVAKNSRAVKQGLDEMFVVNYFAKFLLAKQFLNSNLLNYDGPDLPRIIFVASESHRNASGYDWDGFGSYQPYGIKQSVAMYGYYKLLLLTMASELSRRLKQEGKVQCSVFALCPGPVNSNIAREAPRLFQPLLKLVFGIFFRSPKKACKPVIYLAASKELEGSTGNYMFLMQEKAMDDKAGDPENGTRLWELSEQLEKRIIK